MAHLMSGTNRDKSGHVPVCPDRDKSGQIGTPPLGGDVPICPAVLSLTVVEAEGLFGNGSDYDFGDAGHAVCRCGRGVIVIGSAAASVAMMMGMVPMPGNSSGRGTGVGAKEFRACP